MKNWREEMLNTVELQSEGEMKRVILRMGYEWIDFAYTEKNNQGSIMIDSSYGSWNNGWSAMGEDYNIPTFFMKANSDYLANKLWDHDKSNKVFDSDDANKELKKMILKARKERDIDTDQARVYYDLVNEELDNETISRDIWLHSFFNTELTDFYPEIYETSIGQETSPTYLSLQNLIIPAIKKYFKGELKKDLVRDADIA